MDVRVMNFFDWLGHRRQVFKGNLAINIILSIEFNNSALACPFEPFLLEELFPIKEGYYHPRFFVI
jgi:hypothetical protein